MKILNRILLCTAFCAASCTISLAQTASPDTYPYQTLVVVKRLFPNAVVNTIATSIGGENSEQGSERFTRDVLTHQPADPLSVLAGMVRRLASEYHVGLADFYARFVSVLEAGGDLSGYMAQVNHPNAAGHQVAVGEIARWIAGE